MSAREPAQQTLFGPSPRRRRVRETAPTAQQGTGPVAAVMVDVPHPHLDHAFSYTVPGPLREQVKVGARVSVPFAGRTEDGWVLGIADGPLRGLRPVRRVVTPQPPLTTEVARLARTVADSTAGTLVDVLRAAVPPRHAAAERVLLAQEPAADLPGLGPSPSTSSPGPWADCVGGVAFLERTRCGEGPRAAVRLPLAADPWQAVAAAVVAAIASGRGAVVVLPEVRDVEACAALVTQVLGPDEPVAVLHHGLGPAARWSTFLQVRLGRARVVVGTRSAVFAPVDRPGLVIVWDDGDDGHVEPHAPGWDSAAVAVARAEASGAACALLSHSRSVRSQWWVRTGRFKDVAPDRATRRRAAARVVVPDPADPLEAHARVPRSAHRVVAEALRAGPVLVSVPRSGYTTALQCARCRHAARCRHCSGPLALVAAEGAPTCRWCARANPGWVCSECTGTRLRAGVVGVARSADEIGRAFPGFPVILRGSGHRCDTVDDAPRLVVATPGTEPAARAGYSAALVLDGDQTLARRGLAVEEETLRRWLTVASLVRPGEQGGRVVVVADPAHRVVQAVVQDAPEVLADRLCDERAEVGLPPVRTVARLLGEEHTLGEVAAGLRGESTLLPDTTVAGSGPGFERASVLGPAPTEDGQQWQLLLAGSGDVVVREVKDLLAARSAAKSPGRLVARVDPHDLD